MSAEDLIACAEYLLNRPESSRTQADINRAASTIYYALFHELAASCATFFMGPRPSGHGRRAWQQVYRALEHKRSSSKCKNKVAISKFPPGISNFADVYVSLQERRHQCDYDPLIKVTHTEVSFDMQAAKEVLEAFRRSPEIDLRAFCAYVLFESRDDPARRVEEKKRQKQAAAERKKQRSTIKKE